MYQVSDARALLRLRSRRGLRREVPRTVVLLGLTSLLTDVSSEMVVAVLPLYLVFGLGLSPLQFGIVDGVYQGAAALVRVASGYAGDRLNRHKEVAVLGYGLSAVTRLALPLAGAASTAITAIVTVDRVGKGIRTAPRDAMISLSCSPAALGAAFGVHRAMDTAGAMLGPLVAFGVLAIAPDAFDAVFVVSFCFALLGLGVIGLFVTSPPRQETADPARAPAAERVSWRSALALLKQRRFSVLVGIGAVLSLATVSDGFVYLALQNQLAFSEELLPLLYVGTAFTYMVLAVPVGRLADRFGRARTLIVGYALLLALYGLLLAPVGGTVKLMACVGLLGAYYAATEGVLTAMASSLLPTALRGTGLGLLVTATSLARIVAAIAFGALWTALGPDAALRWFGLALALALALSAAAFIRLRRDHEPILA